MNLITVGLNHTTAPVALREQVAFPSAQLAQAVAAARAWFLRHNPLGEPSEAAILSTCNRTELYVARPAGDAIDAGVEATARFLADYHGLPYAQLRPHLYARPAADAVRHAFRVAAGLDSMVLGEAQILGQMKDAVRHAEAGGGMGTVLHQLFQRTFAVAKEVRSNTAIGANSVSMAAAAVRLAQRIFPSIEGQNILFVGAGAMIELCAAHFAAHSPASITVANRGSARGQRLAALYKGRAIGLADLPDVLAASDIVISCTASALPVIGLGMVDTAIRARRRKPLFMVDLAVPRDIESEVGRLSDVYLYSVDDLGALVQHGREQRQAAVVQAESIIETGVQSFMDWADKRAVVPLIRDMREISETMRLAELQRARKMLARGDHPEAVLEALSKGLSAKFLHGPQHALRQAKGGQRDLLCSLLPQLFRCNRNS